MKKIIFILLLVFYAQPILAEEVLFDNPATCAVDKGVKRKFYICSGGVDKDHPCAGKNYRPLLDSRVWAEKGDTFDFNDETYLCNGEVFESLGVSGVLFNNPATCAVEYEKIKDVFYICSGNVDTDHPCAGINYNPGLGDTRIWMDTTTEKNIGGVNYTCDEKGYLQKIVSTTVDYLWGDKNWCVVEDKLINKDFWLCGDDGSGKDLKCDKRKYRALLGDNRNFYGNHDTVRIGDKDYMCCIETGDQVGRFRQVMKDIEVEATAKVGNGTCTYYQKINSCGHIVDDKPCTVPTKCNEGYELKGNKCVSLSAPAGSSASAGASAANNCPTTDTQGIDRDGICQKCTGATPKWDKTQLKCVANSSTSTQQSGSATSGASSGSAQQSSSGSSVSSGASGSSVSSGPSEPEIIEVTREDVEKCWFCRKKEAFLGCMKSKGNPVNSAYRKDCKLD